MSTTTVRGVVGTILTAAMATGAKALLAPTLPAPPIPKIGASDHGGQSDP